MYLWPPQPSYSLIFSGVLDSAVIFIWGMWSLAQLIAVAPYGMGETGTRNHLLGWGFGEGRAAG